jgi:hypothetical protein
MVLLIWLLASAAKSGLRDPIKCIAPTGHRSLERSHSLLGPRLLAVGQYSHDTVLGLSSLTDELKLFSMSTRNTGLLVQAHSGSRCCKHARHLQSERWLNDWDSQNEP